MSGRKSQAKGRAGELELCSILKGYGYPVEPGWAMSYGSTPDITGLDGIHIEAKRSEQQALYDWLEQAQRDAGKFKDGLPAVFWRKNRKSWVVIMSLSDWMELYQMSRSQVEKLYNKVAVNQQIKQASQWSKTTISRSEAQRRVNSLLGASSTSAMKKFIKKYGKKV